MSNWKITLDSDQCPHKVGKYACSHDGNVTKVVWTAECLEKYCPINLETTISEVIKKCTR